MSDDNRARRQHLSDHLAPPLVLLFVGYLIVQSDDPAFRVIGAVSLVGILAYGAAMIFAAGRRPRWFHGFLIGVGAAAAFTMLLGGNPEALGEAVGMSMVQSAMAAVIMPSVGRLVIGTGDDVRTSGNGRSTG